MISNDVEYIQACTEVNCLLKYFPKEYIEKIPNKLLNMIKTKSDEKYNITVDLNKDLKSQNISKKATDLLVVLKYNYWSNDTERKAIVLKETGENQFIDKDIWYTFLDFCEKRLYETIERD